jgi:magnesium-protoporphyrin IX monomethyl ester (oxidative) cyclase
LGLGYIASYLESKGLQVKVLDLAGGATIESVKEYTHIGISVPFTKSFYSAKRIAQFVKESNPDAVVVMGGIGAEVNPYTDYVVRGEGEVAFYDIVNSSDSDPIDNLDSLPFPLRTFTNPNRVGVVTSRGCPFNCSFCSIHSLWGYKWRARSPENVVEEIKSLNVPYITFEDDNLTLDKDRATKLFELMAKECLVKWSTPNGVCINTIDKDLLTLMKRSGCFALNLAIESGDEWMLKYSIGKDLTLQKVKDVVKWCKELDILTLGYFVIGMPFETMTSMNMSLEFAKELMLDAINVFIASPYPGSALWDYCTKHNYFITKDLDKFTGFDAVFETPLLKARDVQSFRKRFQNEFNDYHDKHSLVSTEKKRNLIRRPLNG